jgi:Cdc6-like AAA superfamily ATPase
MTAANPFTPIFGNEPPILAGRTRLIQDVLAGLENGPGDPNRATIFTGPRGSGKTVLLTKIAEDAEQIGWVSVRVVAADGMLDILLEQLERNRVGFIPPEQRSHITGVQAAGFGVTRQVEPKRELSWYSKMDTYLDYLAEAGVGLLITVDEVTSRVKELILLISHFQQFVSAKRNVALIMAGLPNNVIQMFQHESISFLRRAFLRTLEPISKAEVGVVMRKTVELGGKTIKKETLGIAAEATEGFPFMIQLVGYHMFNQASEKTITDVDVTDGIEIARADMEHMIIDATIKDLSDMDLKFLIAMLEDQGESRMASITKRLDTSSSNAGYYRKRLINLGIITPVGRGKVSMNIPLLRDWLIERYC